MISFYLAGLFTLLTCLIIWFYSPFKSSFGYIFIDKSINTNDQFETALLIKAPFLGKLLGCYICTSFWGSLIIGILFWIVFNLPDYFPLLAWFTYPSIAYLYKRIIEK
jgi:hypothetical protein